MNTQMYTSTRTHEELTKTKRFISKEIDNRSSTIFESIHITETTEIDQTALHFHLAY